MLLGLSTGNMTMFACHFILFYFITFPFPLKFIHLPLNSTSQVSSKHATIISFFHLVIYLTTYLTYLHTYLFLPLDEVEIS